MTRTHRALRKRLKDMAVAAGWKVYQERAGTWIDPDARWRADLIVDGAGCPIAIEAQRGPTNVAGRSEAYMASGVWPLWFFARIPREFLSTPVFSASDVDQLPALLKRLNELPSPKGLTWIDAQKVLRGTFAGVRRAPAAPTREEQKQRINRGDSVLGLLRVEPDLRSRLCDFADSQNMTVAAAARHAIRLGLGINEEESFVRERKFTQLASRFAAASVAVLRPSPEPEP